MIIDFHTHIFPDKVADKAIPKLASVIERKPAMDGTWDGLLKSMEKASIDISLILPTVTNPHQYNSVMKFALQINDEFHKHPDHGLISLAGVHPDSSNINEQLEEIRSLGFAGIKIHPDYQGVFFDDIRYKRILYKASELDLMVLTHTGFDVYSPELIHCTPEMIVNVLDEISPTKLVLAHMGNNMFYDKVEDLLIGRDVYLDTAYSISHMEAEQFIRMIRRHGANKILFGTDCPWNDQTEDMQILNNLSLTDDELALITHRNGLDLLNL